MTSCREHAAVGNVPPLYGAPIIVTVALLFLDQPAIGSDSVRLMQLLVGGFGAVSRVPSARFGTSGTGGVAGTSFRLQ